MPDAKEEDDFRLEMPGAAIRCHRTVDDALDDAAGAKFAGIRAALDLDVDPESSAARYFEVASGCFPGRPVVREMSYFDGIVPRLTLIMDEDNQIEVSIFNPGTGPRRYTLAQLVSLCGLAATASNQASNALALAESLGEENDRLKAEVKHLRKLLGDQAPKPSGA